MRFGLPWRVEGIRYEARETAEAAARRAGLPLNEWLNAIILQQAAGREPKPQPHTAAHDDDRSDDFSKVQLRLDDLTRRIEHVARTGPTAYAPKRSLYDTDQIADRVERLEQRIHEVTSYRPDIAPQGTLHALSGEETHTSDAPLRLDKLEEHLRRITGQIEALKRPGEEAIRTLRAELGDIGRALAEALPRHAIETLEMQIQVLAQRIVEGREAGVDGGTLIGIENGLAEVRDALRDLMPAENLVGYNEAIKALTQKIDLIVADRDPATMQQLERSLATLREMSAHVASNDAVSRLSAQVQTIAEKIDRLAVGPRSEAKLDNLAGRIDALTRALAERTQAEIAVPQRTEAVIRTLSEKIEQLQKFGASNIAADYLEDRIVKLMERIDASDSRFDKLDAIERGLADLLVHIEELRTNRKSSAIRAEDPRIESLTQDIAYTRKSVDAVHRRLGDLIERVAIIEKGNHGGEADKPAMPKPDTVQGDKFQFAPPAQLISAEIPIAPEAPIEPADAPETPAREDSLFLPDFAPPLIPAALPASIRTETPARIDPGLLADQPLEPGSGPPRRPIPPTLRIAASETALGSARPVAGVSASKAAFIAAARRAAQAAGHDQGSRGARADLRNAPDDATPPMWSRVATRAKSALLAASIVAIIAGSFQLLGNLFDFSIFDTIESKLAANIDPDAAGTDAEEGDSATVATIPNDKPAAPGTVETPAAPRSIDVIANLLSPHALPSLTPAPLNGIQSPPQQTAPSLLAPSLSVPGPVAAAPKGDVTGSVAQVPAKPAPQQPAADRLPANIGSQLLRNAALTGDAAAAYEVAMRFVEGRGVAANLEEGARWFERAASKGLTPAQFRYASMLEKGQGVKKDLAAAQRLYIAAASKGHAKAMHNLAVLYAEGAEGKPDYANAAQWFRKAAEHGVPDSQYNLGVLAARGLGTERNMAESYKWFALAAAQGDNEAARKRDEVAAHLDAQTLASVQQAVKSFTPAPQPPEAIQITAPPGGWERTTQPAQEKQRAAGSISTDASGSGKL